MKTFKKITKWTGISLLTILGLLLVAYVFIYILTERRMRKQYEYNTAAILIPTDAASVLTGKHLYQIRGCEDCHGKNLEGSVFMNDPMLMKITAPGLTKGKGGLPGDFTVSDWVRVLRHGVDRDGHSLLMMPSQEFYKITDEDLANIIAYTRSKEAVDAPTEKMHAIGPIGRLLMVINNVAVLPAERIDHKAVPVGQRENNISVATGKYLSTGCQGCHRENMQGGDPLAPGFPPVPDITTDGHLKNWTVNEFMATIQSGKTPEGKTLNNEFMPWQSIRNFTDDELKSIYMYLKSLPTEKQAG